jgi:hypothetical protein
MSANVSHPPLAERTLFRQQMSYAIHEAASFIVWRFRDIETDKAAEACI